MGAIYRRQGSILVFTVIICAALLVLGTSLLDIAGLDMQIALNQRDSIQAYFLAESGIDIVLTILEKHNLLYTGIGDILLDEGKINISVGAMVQEDRGRLVQIISTGKVGIVQEQIKVSFLTFPRNPEGKDGSVLGWYEETSGIIVNGQHDGGDETILLGSNAPTFSLKLTGTEKNSNNTYFAARQIFFQGTPISLIVEDKLEICAETTVFRGKVLLELPYGCLILCHPDGKHNRVYLENGIATAEQHLLLEAGVYSFPHGFQISLTAEPEELLKYRVLPVVPGTMIRRDGR